MMEKIIKTRKDWKCANCYRPIAKGEICRYGEARDPVYDVINDLEQIGIRYSKWHLCIDVTACNVRMLKGD